MLLGTWNSNIEGSNEDQCTGCMAFAVLASMQREIPKQRTDFIESFLNQLRREIVCEE